MKKALLLAFGAALLGGCVRHRVTEYDPGVYPVSPDEAVSLTQAGYPDSSILEKIRQNGVERTPGADDLVRMQQDGVSGAVQTAMLEAPVTTHRPSSERTTVVVDEADPDAIIGIAAIAAWFLGTRHAAHHRHIHTHHCRH